MSSALKHTPLHSVHLEFGARLVDFGGWEMPVSYGSQIEEHRAVRARAGMFDVSHMLNVDLTGAGATAFLRRLLANDVAKLSQPGKALYSCMLNPEGGVIDDLIVYFFSPERWRAVVNAATAEKDVAWMRRVAAAEEFAVAITPRRDLAMVAVQGPAARETVWAARPAWQAATETLAPFTAARVDDDTLVGRTGYTGEDGFEIVLPGVSVEALWRDLAGHDVKPCGLGARDTLRLEAGMNLYGQDMDELTQPCESGLSWTVSFKDPERRFVGRAAIEATGRDRVLLGLKMRERGIMRARMPVRSARGPGEITSGTMSPTLGVSIALARLPTGVGVGDSCDVDIRGKWVPAEVVKLPFVRHGKVLV